MGAGDCGEEHARVPMITVFCLRLAGDPPPPSGLCGPGGTPVRRIVEGALGMWVADGAVGPPALETIRAHDAVVRAALRSATPLPVRYGTGFADEEEARAALRAGAAERVAALERVRGRVEMGVRVVRDVDDTRDEGGAGRDAGDVLAPGGATAREFGSDTDIADESVAGEGSTDDDGHSDGERGVSGGAALPAEAISVPGGGRAYLQGRRRELQAGAERRARAERLLDRVERVVNPEGCPVVRILAPEPGVVGVVAHLVHGADAGRYRTRVEEAAGELPGVLLRVSGPWAPYSFV